MRTDRKVNLSDIVQRAILLEELSSAKGWHNVVITPSRRKATSQQHGYYRAVVVPLAKVFLNETQGGDADGEDFDEAGAHAWLKTTLRGKPVVNKITGEERGVVAASHGTYSVGQMAEFIDDVVALLREFGVTVPPPDSRHFAAVEGTGAFEKK